jgi:hypothetical protein
LGRGVIPKGRNLNSGIVTRIPIEELGRGISSLIRKSFA